MFVSTNTAVFSEASRTAARSHAAAWARKRLKEARAKSKADQDHDPISDNSTPSLDESVPTGNTGQGESATVSRKAEEHSGLSVPSCRSDIEHRSLSRENGSIRRKDPPNLSPAVCGRNRAWDPFDSLAVKVDSYAHDLVQFYRSSPWAWELQPYAPRNNNLQGDSGDIISSSMSSKLRWYTLLSLSAAIMGTIATTEVNPPRATLYSHLAITEMQRQLRYEFVDEQELLQGVSTLSIAAALQGEAVAARAHLQAAKYLVDRLGGFESLPSSIAQRIRYGDFHLALETLSPPVFELVFEPARLLQHQYSPDALLEQLGRSALQFSQTHLPPSLFEDIRRTIHCAEVVDYIWTQPRTSPLIKVEWLASKLGSTMNRLLSTMIPMTTEPHARKAQEATKVILILWNLIVLMFGKCIISPDVQIRGSMPIFGKSTLDAKREQWPPWIYLGLMSWNEIVRSPLSETGDRGTLLSLINVVRSMEAEGLVHLADLMARLYQLEGTYRMNKSQQKDLALVSR